MKDKILIDALEKIVKEIKMGIVQTTGKYVTTLATEALTQYRQSPQTAGAVWVKHQQEQYGGTVSMQEYNHAINEIGQLQEQLKEAEAEIREINRQMDSGHEI